MQEIVLVKNYKLNQAATKLNKITNKNDWTADDILEYILRLHDPLVREINPHKPDNTYLRAAIPGASFSFCKRLPNSYDYVPFCEYPWKTFPLYPDKVYDLITFDEASVSGAWPDENMDAFFSENGFTNCSLSDEIRTGKVVINPYGSTHKINAEMVRINGRNLLLFSQAFSWINNQQDSSKDASPSLTKVLKGETKQAIMLMFDKLHFTKEQWKKYLGDPPVWLKECRISQGSKKASSMWNPVLIGCALIEKNIPLYKLDHVFARKKDWLDEWQEASSLFR